MPNEASKTRKIWSPEVLALMTGKGIDIGCGSDPVLPGVERFDVADGDANHIRSYVTGSYDFVFASHVLEHMTDPFSALRDWLSLLRPGGVLIAIVPDEDLYEQGIFPSVFNDAHTHTFTIAKARSWSPRSINVLDLVRSLTADVVKIELQDHGYDRRLLRHGASRWALRWLTLARSYGRKLPSDAWRRRLSKIAWALGAPLDQTALPGDRLAQIQFIVRRPDEDGR